MKKNFLCALVCVCVCVASCENDAPEINFSHNTTVTVDLTDVIKAINDLSLSMEEKMDLILDFIQSSNTSMEAKLAAIEAALETQTLSIEAKLDILQKAIETQTLDLNAKLAAIEAAIENGITDLNKQLLLVKEALISSLEKEFAKTDSILEAGNKQFEDINRALTILGVETGIMEGSNRDTLYMHPTAWNVINKDEEIHTAFANQMNITDLKVNAKPLVITNNVPYPQGWNLADVKVTPDAQSLSLVSLHSKQFLPNTKPMMAVIRTHKSYQIVAAIPDTHTQYTFNGQKSWCTYDRGSNYYLWGGGVTQAEEEGKYQLTHTLTNQNNQITLYPTVYFVVKATQP